MLRVFRYKMCFADMKRACKKHVCVEMFFMRKHLLKHDRHGTQADVFITSTEEFFFFFKWTNKVCASSMMAKTSVTLSVCY